MQTRKLGNSNLEVSALGLGCMRMSFGLQSEYSIWWTPIEAEILPTCDENIGSVDIELTAADLSKIQSAMAEITVIGDRY